MVSRINVDKYQHLKKRKKKGGMWPIAAGIATAVTLGMGGIYFSNEIRNIDRPIEAASERMYAPWSGTGHRLTKEQAANPGTVLSACAACLREEGIPADKMDLTYSIGKRFEEKYGKKLVWGNLRENDTIPLPDKCEQMYRK